jgi:hypothetical protein
VVAKGTVAVIAALSAYFVFCLRLNYFKKWKYDADVKTA